MSKSILWYDCRTERSLVWKIWAQTGKGASDGFFLPIASADGMMPVLDLMEEIKEKYGLPIDTETIDAHFNRERPEQTAADYAKNFYQVLKHIQVLLSSRLQGDIDVDEVLSAVFEAVDNQNINAAIREYEKPTNGRIISL